jgi:hypothetical protein
MLCLARILKACSSCEKYKRAVLRGITPLEQ